MKKLLLIMIFFSLTSCLEDLFNNSDFNYDPPANFNATDGERGTVTLTWNIVPGVRGYQIQKSISSDFSEVTGFQLDVMSNVGILIDYTLPYTNDTVYYYRVRVYNANEGFSDWSEPDSGYITLPTIADAQTITPDTWYYGEITNRGEIQLFTFDAVSNSQYAIYWIDASGGWVWPLPSCDVEISGFREDYSTPYFYLLDTGHITPQHITASLSEKVIIQVNGSLGVDTGTFELFVSNM